MSIAQFLNQHSYLAIGSVILLILAAFLLVRRAHRAWLIWGALAVVMVAGWLVLRTGTGARLDSTEAMEATIASGRPTLVEFYSDY